MGWEEERANRQKLSREKGSIYYQDWGGKISVALVYPNRYHTGMSSLGIQTLYGLLNSFPGIICERVFYPEIGGSQMVSLESSRPLMDFSILAFSLSYELDYVNALEIIRRAGIPVLSKDRNEKYPLVIAGGPCVISNPEPVSPFFDVFGLGEGEVLLPPFIQCFRQNVDNSRAELLSELTKIPGFYSPLRGEGKASRQWAKDINTFDTTSVILTPDTELASMFLIEIERGCERGCRFCLTGNAFRPFRYRSISKILDSAVRGLKLTRKIGLVGAAVLDHPEIEAIIMELVQEGAQVSCSSLRGDALTGNLVQALVKGGERSLTIAPETGSLRLRKIIGKDLSDEAIYKAAELAAETGLKQLKLYFMLGLPHEEEQDIDELISLSNKLRNIMDTGNNQSRLVLNISPFIPKKGTPFYRYPMARPEILKARINKIRLSLKRRNIDIKSESIPWSQVQAVLSRGDIAISSVISGIKANTIKDWQLTLEAAEIDVDYWAHQDWHGGICSR